MTFDFTTITEVRLSAGPHDRPEDGMCVNEMTAWFFGEPHSDRPACMCPVIAACSMNLNDHMPDIVRNDMLKPMVPKLGGTVSRAHEQERAEALTWSVVKNQVPSALEAIGLVDHAERLCGANTLATAASAARAAASAAGSPTASRSAWAAEQAARSAASAAGWAAWAAEQAAKSAASAAEQVAGGAAASAAQAAWAIWWAYTTGAAAWLPAIDALNEALEIGPEPIIPATSFEVRHSELRELVGVI